MKFDQKYNHACNEIYIIQEVKATKHDIISFEIGAISFIVGMKLEVPSDAVHVIGSLIWVFQN